MIIDQDNFFHLVYCSNIHPGERWSEIFSNLKTYIPPLKQQLAPDKPFGIGLRLSNQAAVELLTGSTLREFKAWLESAQLYVLTLNGFPYGNFHQQPVKEQVYAPDWGTDARRHYSLRLVKILAALTPVGGESGFSTSPLSYKPWLSPDTQPLLYQQASVFLAEVVAAMSTLFENERKLIHIDIEPEPDCLIETIDEMIQFFQDWLIPIGTDYLVKVLKISPSQAKECLHRHIRVCYDVCHSSVAFEEAEEVFEKLACCGIRVGKVQISAALKADLDQNNRAEREKIAGYLGEFTDATYLHQVIGRKEKNGYCHYPDLKDALPDVVSSDIVELRTHFHVPIFLEHYHLLKSTQSDISKVLQLLKKNKATHQLEMETYTWEVLPADLKLDIVPSIKREYEWVLKHFQHTSGAGV